MAGDWKTARLGDLVDSSLGKMLDAQKNKGTPRPYLGNSNVRWGSFDLQNLSLMRFENDEEERYGIRDGDLIVCEGGEPGRCAIWREQIPGMKIQKALHRVRPKDGLNNYYLFYWFMLAGRTDRLEPFFTGTTIKHLTGKALNELEVPVPPIEEQRAIAHILGTLDDKIELNRRRNQTLEAMAHALFKDWFVDFGPVRARMEGRKPYLPREIWDLFPDRLDDEGKPDGWEMQTVGDCFHLTMGQSPPGDTYNDVGDGLPFFQGRTDFGFRYPVNRKFCSAPTRVANAEDTLVSVRAPVGDINLAWEKCCVGRGVAGVRHISDGRSFTYHAIWSLQDELKQFEHTGTVFGAINKKQFEAIAFVEPSPDLIAAYENYAGRLDDAVRRHIEDSRSLAQLRDTLLPKLISGELRIADAERFLEHLP